MRCNWGHRIVCRCSLVVERLLRKQKVAGSIPVVGLFKIFHLRQVNKSKAK